MTTYSRHLLYSACFAASLLIHSATLAQQPVPGSPQPAPTVDVLEADERNPAVRTALELPRETPDDYFRAIIWLIDLGRTDLAAPVLEDLQALEMTDDQRAALVTEFGSAAMLRLARTEELAPAGTEFADRAMTAAAAEARNPQQLAQLVTQLGDPSAEVRNAARADLIAAGQVGANATLEALARETDPARHQTLLSVASAMSPLTDGPLLAMLQTDDPSLKSDVVRLLRHLGVMQAAPFLAEHGASAEQALAGALANYRQGAIPFAPDDQNQVTLWHWSDATKRLTPSRHDLQHARTIWMARLARELAQLRPENHFYNRQALVLGLEARGLRELASTEGDQVPDGPSWPLDPSTHETSLLVAALGDALEQNHPRGAVSIIAELAARRDVAILYTPDGKPSTLARALRHPNRRVRFAALEAIMAIDPRSPYPGSSHFAEALAYFATSSGDRRAVVASPQAARATNLAGSLARQGLEGTATNQGTEAVQLAREASDLEMILVDMDIVSPDIRQVVYELRIFPTTGEIPIALVAGAGRLEDAQRLADEHDRMIAVSRPHSPEAVARIVDQLNATARRDTPTPDERGAQGLQSIAWLARLLDEGRDFYALTRFEPAIEASLYRADVNADVIDALGNLATPNSQLALVNYASQNTLPIEGRRAAASAFHESVQNNGLLLTTDQILTQYDRYNASAQADAQTQQILGALLDSIESQRAEAGTARPSRSPAINGPNRAAESDPRPGRG